jgi:hypothetical protein
MIYPVVVFHVKLNVELWMDFVGKFSFHVKLFEYSSIQYRCLENMM